MAGFGISSVLGKGDLFGDEVCETDDVSSTRLVALAAADMPDRGVSTLVSPKIRREAAATAFVGEEGVLVILILAEDDGSGFEFVGDGHDFVD